MPSTATESTIKRKQFPNPADYISTGYLIHHCGMRDHMRAANMGATQVQEQAVSHAAAVVKALLNGQPTPVHQAPGIQLLAVALAQDVIRSGAERLADDFDLDLDALGSHASSEHISGC